MGPEERPEYGAGTGHGRHRGAAWSLPLVALISIMMLLPMTSGSGARPPYQGSWSGAFGLHGNGCGSATLPARANFSLSTGRGGLGILSTQARGCPPALGGQGWAQANSFLVLWVNVTAPNGRHTMIADLNDSWNLRGRISTGAGCPAPAPFGSNYSYAPPNSTYAYWENVTGALSSCQVRALAYASAFVELVDETNATVFNPSSRGCPVTCDFFRLGLGNESTTGWEFYNYTYYRSGTWTYDAGVSSFNASSATPRTSYHAAGSTPMSIYFNDTFARSHHYVLEIYLHAHADAWANGWTHGRAGVVASFGGRSDGLWLTGVSFR